MEFLSAEWYASLLAIILIDLLIAGDNAVVIAMAAQRLPTALRKRAVIWGTFGAIAVRVLLVFFITQLLAVKGLAAVGGILLYIIAWRLLKPTGEGDNSQDAPKASDSFWSAIKTIIIADTVMGLDNMLAIAAAAKGDYVLVTLGLLISIPIMMGGSLLILKLLDKYPWLTIAGAGLLTVIAGRVILDDNLIRSQWELAPAVQWVLVLGVGAAVTASAVLWYRRQKGSVPSC